MITNENYSNFSSVISYDIDNESILSMTSSQEEYEEELKEQKDLELKKEILEEPQLKDEPEEELEQELQEDQNDCDLDDDFITSSLSDFIANADKMYSDLVADLDLPSSSSMTDKDSKDDEDKQTDNKINKQGKENQVNEASQNTRHEETKTETKPPFLSPSSDIGSPSEANVAEQYNTVSVAKRKAFSPDLPSPEKHVAVPVANSQNNLNEDLDLEGARVLSSDTAVDSVTNSNVKNEVSQLNGHTSTQNASHDIASSGLSVDVPSILIASKSEEKAETTERIDVENKTKCESVSSKHEHNHEAALAVPPDISAVDNRIVEGTKSNGHFPKEQEAEVDNSTISISIEDNFLPNSSVSDNVFQTNDSFLLTGTDGNFSPEDDEDSSDDDLFFPNRGRGSIFESGTTPKPKEESTKFTDDTHNKKEFGVKHVPSHIHPTSNLLKSSGKKKTLSEHKATTDSRDTASKRSTSTIDHTKSKRRSVSSKSTISRTTAAFSKKISTPLVRSARKTISKGLSVRTKNPSTVQKTNSQQRETSKAKLKLTETGLENVTDQTKVKSPREKAIERVSSKMSEKKRIISANAVNTYKLAEGKATSRQKSPKKELFKQVKGTADLSLDMNLVDATNSLAKESDKTSLEKKGDDFEKCDTVTTAESTSGSVTSADYTEVEHKFPTDNSGCGVERSKASTPVSVKGKNEIRKQRMASPKDIAQKSVQKHLNRLKAAREKQLSIGSSFKTPKLNKFKKRIEHSKRTGTPNRTTIPREPNLLTSKRVRSSKKTPVPIKQTISGDPMCENPITTNWGSPTHGPRKAEITPSIMVDLTTPIEPNLSTRERNGIRSYSTSSIISNEDTATLGSDGTKEKFVPHLTEVVPFKLSGPGSEAKSLPPAQFTFAESVDFVERKGFREISVEEPKWNPSVTVPDPPKLSTPKPKEIKSQDQIDEEIMEEANRNPFKARPVPLGLIESKGDKGLPKVPNVKVTTPKPFNLHTSQRNKHALSSIPTTEELQAEECAKQFQARPIPNLSYRPPKTPTVEKKQLTTPKPFRLSTESRETKFRQKTPTSVDIEAKECKHQFHARPMPDLSYRPPQTPKVSSKTVTIPKPFAFESKQRDTAKFSQTISEDEIELSKKFQARPAPSLTYRPPKQMAIQQKKLTIPSPFKLQTSYRLHKSVQLKKPQIFECKQFQARPMPDLRYRPPKGIKQEKAPTTPKPFNFLTRRRSPGKKLSPATDDEIELAKKFHARPMPDLTYNGSLSTSGSQRKSAISTARKNVLAKMKKMKENKVNRNTEGPVSHVTIPAPFHLETDIRHEVHDANLKQRLRSEEEQENQMRIYKAEPPPDLRKKVFTPKHSTKELTTPKPFRLMSTFRHEIAQSLIRDKKMLESEDMKRRSCFKATPAPKLRNPFTPRRSVPRKSLKASEPKLQTGVRAQNRNAFDKDIELRKKTEIAKKKRQEKEAELIEKRKLMEKRRKSASEGGFCFKAKPINSIFKERARKSLVTPV